MQLDMFVIGDYAQAHDGRFTLVGAGLQRLSFRSFPAQGPRLSAAVRLIFESTECDRRHEVVIEMRSPSLDAVMPPLRLAVNPALTSSNALSNVSVDFVYHLPGVVFPESGEYGLCLTVDAKQLGRQAIEVDIDRQAAEVPVLDPLLSAGFQAFAGGKRQEAESLFRQAVEIAPGNAYGHNNLGFVLLVGRQFKLALAEFTEARRLGFDRSDLLGVNIGCCRYGEHRWAEAMAEFAACLQLPSPAAGVLCGIDGDALFLVKLGSAMDYVALVSSSIAWCALRLSEREVAEEHADLARRLASQRPADNVFGPSLEHLGVELGKLTQS